MIWHWDACAAEPVTYLMREYLVQPPAWVERCYQADDGEVCISEAVYQAPGLVVEHEETSPASDSGLLPEPGGVVLVDVQARDEAGNVSMGECP